MIIPYLWQQIEGFNFYDKIYFNCFLGCFCKDQVYLTGILQLLRVRHTLDFHLLCAMGKISFEDIKMLKPHFHQKGTKIPVFMQNLESYKAKLDRIVIVNGLDEWLEPVKDEEKEFVQRNQKDEDRLL